MVDLTSALRLNALDARIVGRTESLLTQDLLTEKNVLEEQIRGCRILFIGGAGSIGSETLKTVLRFAPRTVHIVDHNENGLAELVRNLRSSPDPMLADELITLPFDYGSDPFRLWLAAQKDYDFVLNFAALKHVRSEKDPYSILAMLDTNVLKLIRLSHQLVEKKGMKRLFCVSTDKAANPSSMMGATKRLMEHALFSSEIGWNEGLGVTSARFANVALSNGSLLQSWQNRLTLRQPMACPEGCRRFFVSLRESGHICTLAGLCGNNGNIHVPALNPEEHLQLLQDVIVWFLEGYGLIPYFIRDEVEALTSVERLAAQGKWPVLLTPLDTAGEKPYEEFVADNETLMTTPFKGLNRVPYLPPDDADSFPHFLYQINSMMCGSSDGPITIDAIKTLISGVEESFSRSHVVSTKYLDQRM